MNEVENIAELEHEIELLQKKNSELQKIIEINKNLIYRREVKIRRLKQAKSTLDNFLSKVFEEET